jgi:hypothetical protein
MEKLKPFILGGPWKDLLHQLCGSMMYFRPMDSHLMKRKLMLSNNIA